jgi:hypothetical protein
MTERGVPRPIPWINKVNLYTHLTNTVELSVLKDIVDAFPALITLYQTTTKNTLLAPVNSAILAIPNFATLLSTANPWLEIFARYILLKSRVNYLDFINDTKYNSSNYTLSNLYSITANVNDIGDSYDVVFQDVLDNQASIISRGYITTTDCNMMVISALLIPSNPP